MTRSLADRARDPGYTPGLREVPALLELLCEEDEDAAKDAARAVLRVEAANVKRAAELVAAHARKAERPGRGRLTQLAGRMAEKAPAAVEWLLDALADADPKTRRSAARALGKLAPTDAIRAALARAWDAAENDDDKKALAEALGKVGGEEARTRLRGVSSSDKKIVRATIMIEREEARKDRGGIDRTRALAGRTAVRFHSKDGLEDIVIQELGAAWKPRVSAAGRVDAELEGPLSRALDVRTALHPSFPLAPRAIAPDVAEAVVDVITSPDALAIFRTFTKGAIRFRVAFAKGGHRRADAWRIAELVRAKNKELVNDPTDSTWEVIADEREGHVHVELVPRGYEDTRFAYRKELVPASSHPTLAAAIARAAPRTEDDVVWDPFAGAGAELVERAYLGPYAELVGTDIDDDALRAARANVRAASLSRARIEKGDATKFVPPNPPTLILTNPPMGRRLHRGTHGDVLERFVQHAAEVLAPGGTLVWTVPEPKKIRPAAKRAGLELERWWVVDMGGFPAELSVYGKRRKR